ncbi:hypothetical protein BKA70DRAFT_1426090 [Coprinopsis sp. MPI-PUGE-AT-0042]|nr:hypothetical protein BKA70DRAFT_1426090 [Coprinopsis sp. MPI-PUGE-AT-0042]
MGEEAARSTRGAQHTVELDLSDIFASDGPRLILRQRLGEYRRLRGYVYPTIVARGNRSLIALTARSTNPVLVLFIAREETETNPGATDKQLNLKELRLAAGIRLRFSVSMSAKLLLSPMRSPSIAGSASTFDLHASPSSSAVFVSGEAIPNHRKSPETETTKLAELQASDGALTPALSKAPA